LYPVPNVLVDAADTAARALAAVFCRTALRSAAAIALRVVGTVTALRAVVVAVVAARTELRVVADLATAGTAAARLFISRGFVTAADRTVVERTGDADVRATRCAVEPDDTDAVASLGVAAASRTAASAAPMLNNVQHIKSKTFVIPVYGY
jgi:hypothetical protein